VEPLEAVRRWQPWRRRGLRWRPPRRSTAHGLQRGHQGQVQEQHLGAALLGRGRCLRQLRQRQGERQVVLPRYAKQGLAGQGRALRDALTLAAVRSREVQARVAEILGAGPPPRASTELSLAGYASTIKTSRTSGGLQRQVHGRGQIVPLPAVAAPVPFVVEGLRLHHGAPDDQRARRECLLRRRRVRTPVKVISKIIKQHPTLGMFEFRAMNRRTSQEGGRTASGHSLVSVHSELREVLRPTGDYTSLQNVSLFRRPRTTEDNSLFNQFGNIVSLGPRFSRSSGRVYLEEEPLNRPPHRQDEGPVAGGVSRYRPVGVSQWIPTPGLGSPLTDNIV
jgi:hypothetical protein